MGCWVQDYDDEGRTAIYNFLVGCLCDSGPMSDLNVKLSCVRTLNAICEQDWDFLVSAFQPLAAPSIQALYSLLSRSSELDSHTLILETLSSIVRRMGKDLGADGANAAVAPLLSLWQSEQSEVNTVLRRHVLTILVDVAGILSPSESVALYPVVFPMLAASLQGEEGAQLGYAADTLHLVEDALKLLLTLLRIAPAYNEPFHAMFPKVAFLVISCDWEHLRASMMILESYIFLGGTMFLTSYAQLVNAMFLRTIGEVKGLAAPYVALPLEALLRKYPREGTALLSGSGGILCRIASLCAAVREGGDETESDLAMVHWLTALARAILADKDAVEAALASTGRQGGAPPITGADIVKLYLELFDGAGRGGGGGKRRRKLWVATLVSLLPPPGDGTITVWCDATLKDMDVFLDMCVDVLVEIHGADGAGPVAAQASPGESCDYGEEDCVDGGRAEYETRLARELELDEVARLDLRAFAKSRIDWISQVYSQSWGDITNNCDPALIQKLRMFLG